VVTITVGDKFNKNPTTHRIGMKYQMQEEIKKVLRENVNPILAQHNGAAEFSAYEEGVVYVRMSGSCGTCPSAQSTLEDIVKAELTDKLPTIQDVRIDMSVSDDLIEMAKKILNKEV